MEQWKLVLLHEFGKKSHKKWKTVSVDILLVDQGIKRAYLFDQWSCSHKEIESLLLNLRKNQLIHRHLEILSVGSDCLIYSPDTFQRLESTGKIIDISSALDEPILMDDVRTDKFVATYQAFHDFLHYAAQKTGDKSLKASGFIPTYEIEVSECLNPSSMFGLILGYPFIYWYDMEKGDNCLSLQPLRLYVVKGSGKHDRAVMQNNNRTSIKEVHGRRISITKPKPETLEEKHLSLTEDLPDVSITSLSSRIHDEDNKFVQESQPHQCLNSTSGNMNHPSTASNKSDVNHHVIFSFTVPENLFTRTVETHVQNWFSLWQSSVHWSSLFSHVWMEDSLVEPQAVCL